MRRLLAIAATLLILLGIGPAVFADNPKVRLQTSKGPITIELYPDKAPASVENFLRYVDKGFYDGTIFHRVIPDFMIQGGGFTDAMRKKPTDKPVKNEADNGLKNERGTVAMARTSNPDSATAQFFINHKDNDFLNHRSKDRRGWGYAVFGKVSEGMDVVDTIAKMPTGPGGPFPKDVPQPTVVIENASRL
jgi:peptidyl-prolyl cis-trans isomerase A (cyclophilin A)/peptidyl-prolyl cis-trans isomerase B (cyclophilin B)